MQPLFLIASPQMADPFFEDTLVLIWHHDEDGAVGVVVNRALSHSLNEVLQMDVPDSITNGAVGWGGPVEGDSGTIITAATISEDEGWSLPGGLSVSRSQTVLAKLLETDEPFLLCLGYAGWGPGQLDEEISKGGWLHTEVEAPLLFDTEPGQRYEQALARLGLTRDQVWMTPIDE